MKRKSSSVWEGTGLEGKGSLTMQSGVFKDQPFSFMSRFKNEDGQLGTNPEELIAAAHAGCFNMALSFMLNANEYTAEKLETTAVLSMEQSGVDWTITTIELDLKGKVPGITKEKFEEIANMAKAGCPVSKVLNAEIKLNITLL